MLSEKNTNLKPGDKKYLGYNNDISSHIFHSTKNGTSCTRNTSHSSSENKGVNIKWEKMNST
jgi:hypothetical protein